MSLPAFLPPALRTLLADAGLDDRSSGLSVAALVAAADDTGASTIHDVVLRYRDAYLFALRAAGGDDERERGRLSLDEIRAHLETSDLPRLAGAGVVVREGDRVVLSASAWPIVRQGREELLATAFRPDAPAAPSAAGASGAPPLHADSPPEPMDGSAPPALPPARPAVGGSTLEAHGLVKVYRRRRVVNGVDITVRQGEIVGLLGPNGAGKTTSFYQIVGLIAPDEGRVMLDGEDITDMPMYQRARRGVGYLSQEPSIFRKLTVEENILAILETLPIPAAERTARLEQLLDELSIKHLRKSKAFALSGGERRRLEITRALVTRPKFMMLDEPFAGVDPIAVHDIQQIVAGLRHRGIGVVISDHNVEQTLDIVDRAYIMFDGQVKVSGTVRELVFDDTVADIYLGPTLTARLRQRFADRETPSLPNDETTSPSPSGVPA
jgi:lipopolysaccharide export system ATP-binding protein